MIEKLCVLALALCIGVPLLSLAGIRWTLVRRALFVFSIAATSWLTLPLTDMSILWDATYRGSTRGLSVGLSDFAVLALAAIVWHARRRMNWWPAGSWLFGAMFVWCVGTGMAAERPLYVAFEAMTLARVYLLYWVLVNYFEEFGDLRLLLTTLAAVVVMQSAVGAQQHLAGQYRATGTVGDPNLLGMYTNVLLVMLLALAMETRGKWQVACVGAFFAGAMLVLITYSRGAWLVGAGTAGLVCGSLLLLNLRTRKFVLLAPCLVLVLLLLTATADGIAARWQGGFGAITESRDSARTLGPALAMVRDYPVTGVGLNHMSLALNTRHYGDVLTPDERQVTHNLYVTTAAETGLVGMVLFGALAMSVLLRGMRLAWRSRHSPIVLAFAVGATAAVVSVAVHSSTEWVARVVIIGQVVAVATAVLAALEAKPERSALRRQAGAW